MTPESALDHVTRAVIAAFPDRADDLLDTVERMFRISAPAHPAGNECAFCGRGSTLRFGIAHAGPVPVIASPPFEPWSSHEIPFGADLRFACLDCLLLVREEVRSDPPSAKADRTLADVLRAVRAAGGEDADALAASIERAFGLADVPRALPFPAGGTCVLCGLHAIRAVAGTARGALCMACSEEHWRVIGIDPLTGVERRPIFGFRLQLAVERARRAGQPLAMLMVDVDWMKSFNDIHGFIAGDAVLCRLPFAIQESLSPRDAVARWGGEEFVVMLPQRTVREAVSVAESIRKRALTHLRPPDLPIDPYELERRTLDGRQHFPEGRVSVSIGVAGLHPDATVRDLFRIADERLQDAKRSGRNAVCA